ncbi:hypothetical protein IW492_10850 [Enterococcus sp. BWB1-3]|uniref:glucose-6-phosphate isomerase family protein n=1 Tax=unclassified Enterococcus TaxID=2608891 RepID=UPI001920C1D4|nr:MULTISPECIES: glucose-6-phosphate isomerase family protein [unclassified Enterococcus]MBL1229729.1 hypothetical protein [Enterococcus sp. BWB1-3]MCB5952868.1 hypothetical protein [Enterococcus sp. BWT-B8]MCB5953877.1 hypothetical protein [Enterococcus sp. CWB-B31]
MICFNKEQVCLTGKDVIRKQTKLKNYANYYQMVSESEDFEKVIYEVEYHDNGLIEGVNGGLFFGISHIMSGKIGNEYHMTKGHIHQKKDTGEYYWGLKGEGLLLLVFKDKTYRLEEVKEGSVHYIPGNTSHRLINTGTEKLSVGACWLTESGHDYLNCDFPIRVIKNGEKAVEIINCTSQDKNE